MQNYTCITILHAEAMAPARVEISVMCCVRVLVCLTDICNVRTAELWMSTACGARRSGMDNSPESQVLAQSSTRQIQVLAKLGQH
jgi:hypothetical protein